MYLGDKEPDAIEGLNVRIAAMAHSGVPRELCFKDSDGGYLLLETAVQRVVQGERSWYLLYLRSLTRDKELGYTRYECGDQRQYDPDR